MTCKFMKRSIFLKLLEENIGKTLSDRNHSRILYDPPLRILEIKAKINKWDLMKLKSFCTTKETISKLKTALRLGENNSKRSNKGFISKIYKQLLQLNSRKINDPIKKGTKDLNRHFSKEDIQMAKKTHEKMLNITHYQRNANQNHNEVPLHASQDGCYPKV